MLGAGVTGCAAAFDLARRGRRVAVIDPGRVGEAASLLGLGHLAVGLPIPYTVAAERLGGESAREIWECHRENLERLRERLGLLKAPCGYDPRGTFTLALDREEARHLAESEDALRDDGFSGEFLDHYMAEARFDVRGFAGAYWAADGAEIDGRALAGALASAAEIAGATVFESSRPRAWARSARGVCIETEAGVVDAEVALVTSEGGGAALVPFLAERVRPLRIQSVAFRAPLGPTLPSPVCAGRGRAYWRVGPDRVVVGGLVDLALAEESTEEPGTTFVVQRGLEAFAREHLPLSDAPVTDRASVILELSVDGFPIVGRIPGEPLVAALAASGPRDGSSLLAAQWAAELVAAGKDNTPPRYASARVFEPGAWPPWSSV